MKVWRNSQNLHNGNFKARLINYNPQDKVSFSFIYLVFQLRIIFANLNFCFTESFKPRLIILERPLREIEKIKLSIFVLRSKDFYGYG